MNTPITARALELMCGEAEPVAKVRHTIDAGYECTDIEWLRHDVPANTLLYAHPAPAPASPHYPHTWDDAGERCTVCGDKDWMGGGCTPPAPAYPDFEGIPPSSAQQAERIKELEAENTQLRKLIEKGRVSNATELGLSAQLEEQRNGNIKLLERIATLEAQLAEAVGLLERQMKYYAGEIDEITEDYRKVKAEQVEDTKSLVRLLETVKYLRGIAVKGLGREQREDETVEQFVLGYVKELEAVKAERDLLLKEKHGRKNG